MTTYHVLIEQDEDGGYVGKVPELTGCLSQGDTLDELMANIKEAIELCLEVEETQVADRFVGVQEITV
ncbi:MAG: type II toxin-antitoxin system HicB family antitoxin [Candidatus Woesearchaeota archaeon]|nr:type II toxin-antitoxin system HicB family antitoxin [Candidatus Woesearchaeota archaeon]